MSYVKVCGRRGLVTFCSACNDWKPVRFEGVDRVVVPTVRGSGLARDEEHLVPSKTGAWCGSCGGMFPEVTTYEA